MRWLLIGLLISLAVLLFAVAAVARYIFVQHKQLHDKADQNRDSNQSAVLDADEADIEQ